MSSEQRNTGRVKWFNAKRGYGFIIDNTTSDEIFVHHSSIITPENVFKTLLQGEYVEFVRSTDASNKVIATSVCGINNGPLMCQRERKPQSENDNKDSRPVSARGRSGSSRGGYSSRDGSSRGSGNRGGYSSGSSRGGSSFRGRHGDDRNSGDREQSRRPFVKSGGYKPSGGYAKAASSKSSVSESNDSQ